VGAGLVAFNNPVAIVGARDGEIGGASIKINILVEWQ
jgi:hypothetical protein